MTKKETGNETGNDADEISIALLLGKNNDFQTR